VVNQPTVRDTSMAAGDVLSGPWPSSAISTPSLSVHSPMTRPSAGEQHVVDLVR